METIVIPPERQPEFRALEQKLERLRARMNDLEKRIRTMEPFPTDLFEHLREMVHEELAIIEQMKALGRSPAGE